MATHDFFALQLLQGLRSQDTGQDRKNLMVNCCQNQSDPCMVRTHLWTSCAQLASFMATITYKESTLNRAADIVQYANRNFYYLRVKREGKRYTMTSLKTMDIQVARKVSIDSYLEIMKDPPKRRIKKKSFIKACEEYLEHKHQQAHRKLSLIHI